jgi:integrase
MPRHAGPFQIVLRHDTGGKPVYYARFRGDDDELLPWRSTGLESKTAARAWAQREIKRGSAASTRVTFAKYAENWWTKNHPYVEGRIARGHKLTATYLVVMRGHLANHVLPYFEDRRLAQITARQIEDWILKLRRERLAPQTINHALRCLKVMLKEAARHAIISRDPSAFITGLAERPVERGILTGEEVRRLFDEKRISKTWGGDRKHYVLNLLAASTGMRMGEIQALPIGAVHDNYVEISQSWERRDGIKAGTKTGAGRVVPLPAFTARHVRELVAASPYQEHDDLVFHGHDRHTPITPRMILAGLYGALEAIKITPAEREERNITFHSWRHFINTALRVAKVADPLVQRVTGHRTAQMTDHYSHFALEDFRDVMKVQERLLAPEKQSK